MWMKWTATNRDEKRKKEKKKRVIQKNKNTFQEGNLL